MTSAPARYGYGLSIILGVLVGGCDLSHAALSVQVADLARDLDRAERRPSVGYDLAVHVADGIAHPAIMMPVPGRAIWSLPLPRHGVFRAFVTLDRAGAGESAVRFRFGVSDHRVYEGLAECTLREERGWTEFRTDLSAYAGFKWSLFYRPDRTAWRIVLATDALGSGPARAVWGSPEILTDASSAREYQTRRRQNR
jgi:hypothetical protein